jgi:glutamyl-Q tRNA(Asp) synthetase
VVRFAPSSNGFLHLGHAYSALINQAMARAAGMRMLLRIEDIDLGRCRPEFEAAIYEDLAWLGLDWVKPARRQSEHFDDYGHAIAALEADGLVYPCFCSRGDVMNAVAARAGWPRDPDGAPLYPGTCRHLDAAARARRSASGAAAALRLDMTAAVARLARPLSWREYGDGDRGTDVVAAPAAWGDPVLSRKDIPASYHIAVVVDDALQGVTDVVRGEDLFQATSLHRLLQALLDLPAPAYHHHRLIRDAAGRKLAKSLRAKPLRAYRREGATPADILREIALPQHVRDVLVE